MKMREITSAREAYDAEPDHAEALNQTGFWGKAGAGCIFLAKATGRLGIVHRGPSVEQPNTWGTIGGAIDPNESPQRAVEREGQEEVGYTRQHGDYFVPLDMFESGTFRYTTLLYVVEAEFNGRLNWESQDFNWFTLDDLPQPLHFGIAATLSKTKPISIIKTEIAKYRSA